MNRKKPAGMLLVVLFSALILAGMSFLLYSKLVLISNNDALTQAEESGLEQDSITLRQLEKLSSEDKALKSYISACNAMLPEKPEESALMDYIQGISNDAMADLVQIQFEPQTKGEKYITMPLKVTFESKYEDMLAFLEKLRNGTRAIRIDGIHVTGSDSGENTVRTELTCNAFYIVR